jgi:hypothetical protein
MGTIAGAAPAAPTSSPSIKFNPPEVFDGSPKKFRTWLRDLEIFLAAYEVTDDAKRILAALSYMRGGNADEFVQQTANDATSQTPYNWGTWADFKRRLATRFQHANFKKEAREQLEHFRQGGNSIDEFFTKLDMLFFDAGLTDDAEKQRILEKSIRNDILMTIYSSDALLPADYDTYKAKALQIGRQKERFRQLTAHTSSSSTSKPAPSKPQYNFVTQISHPTKGSAPTQQPHYAPMDVDRTRQPMRCFNCGKTGHLRRDCPDEKTKLNIRVLLSSLEDSELEELRETMNGDMLKEQDFVEDQ